MVQICRIMFFSLAFAIMSHAIPTITLIDLASDGVTMTPASSDSFRRTVEEWMTPSTRQTLRPILPYSVLVRNTTASAWIAICVRWELKNAMGQPIWHAMTFQTWVNDRARMVRPGETVFMAPQAGLNRKVTSARSEVIVNSPTGWPNQRLFESQTSIQISLDSVVLEDGLIIGPDRNHTMEKINAYISAETDLSTLVVRSRGEVLRGLLVEFASAEPAVDLSRPIRTDPYLDHRHRLARSYLTQLDNLGEQRVIEMAQAAVSVPRIPRLRKKGD